MSESIHDRIQRQIERDDVVLYMKGVPEMPMCGFSAAVSQVLKHLGVPYQAYNILEDPELRQGIKDYSSWPTIPQLYVRGEFVGGCDIVREMFQSGELETLLRQHGIALDAGAPAQA